MQVTDAMVAKALVAYDAAVPEDHGASANGMEAALSAALAEMWRPIEEAPKDGERVLLGFRDSMSAEGYWHDGSRNHWKREGWYFADDDLLTGRPCDPDCYMPLPVPAPPMGK